VGILAGSGFWLLIPSPLAVLVGWDAMAATYVAWAWIGTRTLDPPATARLARQVDPGRAGADVLLLGASVASLIGVFLVIVAGGRQGGNAQDLSTGLAVMSVALSWALVHTVFTERYARLYHTDPAGGIDFNESDPPHYLDFAYFAFTVGMTFQVSDTDIGRKSIRAAVLRHALLSYLFGAVIIASTINLLASLAK
jgi:uncharacterized membrane protein